MAKKVTGSRANKPNDSFGVVNNPNLYKNKYREEVDRDDDEEQEEVQAQDPTQEEEVATQEEQAPNPTSFVEAQKKDDTDYKKRYDDLKRHYDAKLQEWKNDRQDMLSRLSASQPSQAEVQNNDSSLDQFKNQYPDVYEAIDKISASKSELKVKKLEEDLLSLKEKEAKLEKEKAYQELLRLQPDFDTLKTDDKFTGWLDQQPTSISDGIYNNNTDAKWASRVVDLYKADIGTKDTKKSTVNKSKDAAMSVSKTNTTNVATSKQDGKIWKVSEIAKLKPWEFEKLEKEIDQARAEGRITQ
tara:strand:- start:282 stop:1181 length:900 start_codon:yes stop_codon:yes gene_type:complete